MANRSGSSSLEDPLEGYSVLSLFPRTFSTLPNPPRPYEPYDIHHTHNFLKSVPVQSPNKLLDQAKAIVDSSSELLTSEMPSNVASKEKNEIGAANFIKSPQERRPGLGRKRARFSLKPNISQPTVSLEPSLDIDKLNDPEEFFLAYEKFENAKREWHKQTGGTVLDTNQNNRSTRPRRPGILGRRSVKYKHCYPTDSSTQETFEEDILSPFNRILQEETTDLNVTSHERGLAGSVTKTENKINEILDELLTKSYGELDGDGAVSLLQERLKIKPINLEKLFLPDLQDVQRIDLKASGRDLPKPRIALSDIHNFKKATSSRTPTKNSQAESSVHCLASPTPPKSLSASISQLQKHSLQLNPLNDPFSAHNIDQSPARDASPIGSMNKQSGQVDARKDLSISRKLESLMNEENDTAVADARSCDVGSEDFTGPSDKFVSDGSTALGSGIHVKSRGFRSDMDDNLGGSFINDSVINNLSRPDTHVDVQTVKPNEFDDKVEDTLQEAVASAQPDLNMEDSTLESSNGIQSHLDQSDPSAAEDHAMNGPSKAADRGQEQHNEKVPKSSRIQMNKESKSISRPSKGRESKGLLRRQSLAAAGTSWESGVRRSTRIRSRPLEYWKGERFLYGRIHRSLATVIGIKYESPAKGVGKPALKVKSFVSDEYKDLVELAAMH